MINISYGKLESRLQSVMTKYKVRQLNNQLITDEYIRGLLQEIQTKLHKEKKVRLIDVALAHDIDLGYLKDLVFDHFAEDFSKGLSFDIQSSFLFSKNYFRFVTSKVLDIFYWNQSIYCQINGQIFASLHPLNISDLCTRYMIKRDRLEEYLVSKQFQVENDLILSPLFLRSRLNDVQTQIFKNGKVDFDYLRQHHMIVKPKKYIEKELRDQLDSLVFLTECCLNSGELERILISIQDELNRTGFCDIEDHVSYTLKLKDMRLIFEIVAKTLSEKSLDCIQQKSLILSTKFLSKCQRILVIKDKMVKLFEDFVYQDFKKNISILRDNTGLKNLFNDKLGLDYNLEERLQDFLFSELRDQVDQDRLSKQYYLHKKKGVSKKIKTDFKFSFSSLSVKALLERFEFIGDFYLLGIKTRDTLRAKSLKIEEDKLQTSQAILDFMDINLKYLNQVLIHLMFTVFLKKFNSTTLEESLFSGTDYISHFSSYFEKIFKSKSTLYSIFSSLPKDIRKTIRSCSREEMSLSEINQDKDVR